MEKKETSKSKFGRTIIILLVCFVLVLCLSFWIQSRIVIRHKSLCSRVEADANEIAAAIFDYLSANGNHRIKLKKEELENLVLVSSPWTLTSCGDDYYIHVIDRSGKCPAEYQHKYPEWHANIFTLKF